MKPFGNYEYQQALLLRRTPVPSSNDVQRMAMEKTRTRFISPLNAAGPKEVSSFYRSPSRCIDAPYSNTSRKNTMQNLQNISAIPTFPTLVKELLFCDQIDTDSQTYFDRQRKFSCKCRNCTKPHCLAKILARKRSVFRDNIMTFCDRGTMTPQLVHATCGISQCSSMVYDTNDMSCIAIRGTDCRTPVSECGSKPPTPILKRCPGQTYYDCTQNRMAVDENECRDLAIRDCEASQKPERSGSLKCFFRLPKYLSKKHQSKCTSRTKHICNESISTGVTCELPGCPVKTIQVTLPPKPKSTCSRSADTRRSCTSDMYIPIKIPHSHKYESKYHVNCKRSNESRHRSVSPCPRPVRLRCYERRPIQPCALPDIRLPKKVLTSERNIEAFIKKHNCNTMCGNRW